MTLSKSLTALLAMFILATPVLAVETDRLMIQNDSAVTTFKVTSEGNTTGNSLTVQQKAGEANTTPKLIVKDTSGNTVFAALPNGTLGVGTASPVRTLEAKASGGGVYGAFTVYRDSLYSGGFIFSHARGTSSSPTYLNAGDRIGSIFFKAYDGTNINPSIQEGSAASVEAFAESAFSTYTPGYLVLSTTPALTKDPIERVRVTSSGNVGIGTTAPTAKLDINGNGIRIEIPRTPASSSEACNQGDIVWDSNYLYVCVASNSWKRAALASW